MVKSGLTIHPSILTPIEQVNLVKCGLTKHILAVSQSYQSSASFSAPYFWSELTFNQKQNNSARNDSVQKWQAKELPSLQVNRSPKPEKYGLTMVLLIGVSPCCQMKWSVLSQVGSHEQNVHYTIYVSIGSNV